MCAGLNFSSLQGETNFVYGLTIVELNFAFLNILEMLNIFNRSFPFFLFSTPFKVLEEGNPLGNQVEETDFFVHLCRGENKIVREILKKIVEIKGCLEVPRNEWLEGKKGSGAQKSRVISSAP